MAKIFLTAGTTSWGGVSTDGSDIVIEAIGAGGDGHSGTASNVGTGGGGGAYAVKTVPYTSLASVSGITIGAGGSGTDTNWNSGVVIAKAGVNATDGGAGSGGAAASCTPSTGAFSGGIGGAIGANSRPGAGGGGSAGPNGDGKAGGVGGGGTSAYQGAGGGGAGGGSSTAGGVSGGVSSGAGGTAQDGTAGGAGVSGDGQAGNPGSHGSGGSGGAIATSGTSGAGGSGGNGVEFDATHGAGGGGGGGGGGVASIAGDGGAAGSYGGGGGGGGFGTSHGAGGTGGGGLIVITYTPAAGDITLSPGAGSLTITPGTPVVTTSPITLAPGAGTLTITPGTPTVSLSQIMVSPVAGSLAISPGTPVVTLSNVIELTPGAATLTITGGTATLSGTLTLSPGTGALTITPGTPGVSLVTTAATGNTLIIGGVTYLFDENQPATISKRMSGAWSATFSIVYRSGSKPLPGQEVALFWESVKRFGGVVLSTSESRIKGPADVTRIVVTCTGFQSYLNRVVVAKLYPAATDGYIVIIADVVNQHLLQFGVSFVSGQGPTGDTQEQLAHYITGAEVFGRVRDNNSGWDYWIDDNKALFWRLQGTGDAAPFTIRDGDVNQDAVTAGTSNAKFRNRQWVLPSANIQTLITDTFVIAVGQTQVYINAILTVNPIVKRNGTLETCTHWEGMDGDATWHWIIPASSTYTAVFRSPLATPMTPGDIVTVSYPTPFPSAVFVEDAASIADVGLYESVYQAKNVIDEGTATALAQALLDAYGTDGNFPQSFKFNYNSHSQPAWLLPGMVVDVLRTFPRALGDYVVEEINSSLDKLTVWRHSVTLRFGQGDVSSTFEDDFIRAARVPIVSPPVRVTFELDISNAGQSTGFVTNRYTVQLPPGVAFATIQSWDAQFPTDPPTGSGYIADIYLNGASIFPSGSANKINVADGSTAVASGMTFVSNNLTMQTGDVITFLVIQVGSTTPGSYALIHLNYVV